MADVHCRTGKDIGRANEYWETNGPDEGLHIVHSRKFLPFRLVHTECIDNAGEFVAVLGLVDIGCAGSQDRHSVFVHP